MRRELAIALRARVTWLVAALSALLVGHGFVLAVDLFSASSRSALASALQAREMDPLAGVVRPALGGVDLALTLLGPLVAARVLALEKERRTFGALCLEIGSPARVVLRKLTAAAAATLPILVAPLVLLLAYRAAGGHVDAIEAAVALAGEGLHLALVVAVSLAAAAWTRTLAQAAAAAVVVSLTSWAIDAADGFAALAWLGGASAWSIERQLAPFQRGVVALGSIAWLSLAALSATALAIVGAELHWPLRRRLGAAAAIAAAAAVLLAAASRARRAYDWTEARRASLPPAAVDALRALDAPLRIDVYLDRDDSRRRQLETDVLAKLALARPDLVVRTPLDEGTPAEAERDAGYGRVIVHVGGASRETRSTSRREIATLIFEAAGRPLPDWTQPPYPGFPAIVEGPRRTALAALAYAGVPLAFAVLGAALTRRRTSR